MLGKAWPPDDDNALKERWFSPGAPTAAMLGEAFARSQGAIIARLVHLGVYPDRDSARQANALRIDRVATIFT